MRRIKVNSGWGYLTLRAVLILLLITILVVAVLFLGRSSLPPRAVSFTQSAMDLEAYDFVEIAAQLCRMLPTRSRMGPLVVRSRRQPARVGTWRDFATPKMEAYIVSGSWRPPRATILIRLSIARSVQADIKRHLPC